MNRRQRAINILIGIITILSAPVILAVPEAGVAIILFIICASFIVNGLQEIIYYATMARHMVGGKIVLYKGIIMLDMGLFTLSLTTVPHAYIMLYLVAILLFEGVIDVIRTLESKKMGARSWKLNLRNGMINIAIAIICIASVSSDEAIVLFYAIGLIYTGVMRVVRAFRRTDIVYIQ